MIVPDNAFAPRDENRNTMSAYDAAISLRTITVNATLARDLTASTSIPAPYSGIVTQRFFRPGARLAAGDHIVLFAPESESETRQIAITAPVGGLVLRLAEVGARVQCGAPLGTLSGNFIAECTAGPDAGAFTIHDVVEVFVTCAGTRHSADIKSVKPEGNTRRVRLNVQDVANVLAPGAIMSVTLTIQPTAAMIAAERAEKLKAWPYPIPPRGVNAVQLGLIPPRSGSYVAITGAPSVAANKYTRRHARRDAGAYAPVSPRETTVQPSHRNVLGLALSAWNELAIATASVQIGSIAVHVDVTGRLVREPAPLQSFFVTAPVLGHCQMTKIFVARDVIRAGDPIAIIALDQTIMDTQARYLTTPANSLERLQLFGALRQLGMREPDLMTITRTCRTSPTITIYAPIDGLVDGCASDGPVASGTTIVRLTAANTDIVTCRMSLTEFAKLSACIGVRLRFGAKRSAIFAAPLVDVWIDDVADRAHMRIPIPAGAVNGELGQWVDLRLEDAASRHEAKLVPATCLAQVGKSWEVLVHIGPGQLRPVSVTTGLRGDGFVEIVDGLDGDETLVDHLTDLADEVDAVRALLLGFWRPSIRMLGAEACEHSGNPLTD